VKARQPQENASPRRERNVEEIFDYVVVGSGAAGATAARTLVDYGVSVAVVEEGPAQEVSDFSDRVADSFSSLYRDKGAQITRGREAIKVLQASCLGGTTVINSGIMWRIPEDVWQPWSTQYGLGESLALDHLHTHWDRIEKELGVRPVQEDVWGEQNRLMERGRLTSGLSGGPVRRNERQCHGSALCFHGCPHGAKQSMLVSYLPYAAQHGSVLFSEARVERILVRNGRAAGVSGRFRSRDHARGRRFRILARRGVLVAASAIQTPLLLQRSGVRSPHLGRHLQGHPGASMMALFDHPVNMWFGATQGYEVDHYRKSDGFKIETISLPPELILAQTPGIGSEWVRNMAQVGQAASWGLQLRAEAHGQVRQGLLGTEIHFQPTRRDMERLRHALRRMAELFFAAGAREVLPLVYGAPERLSSPDQARRLEEGPLDPASYTMTMSHLFGTARMSREAKDGVVGLDFGVHGVPGLYVVDSSIFPTNLGVNPQLPIMGVAMEAAHRIAQAYA
jgi:choline dehydrogenase-like flavoprotein